MEHFTSPMKKDNTIRSDQYRQQPSWFTLLNRLWVPTYPLGTKSVLTKESLIKAAIEATGFDDFGSDDMINIRVSLQYWAFNLAYPIWVI